MSIENFLEEMRESFATKDTDRLCSLYCLPLAVIEENQNHMVNTHQELKMRTGFMVRLMEKANVIDLSFKMVSQVAAGGRLTMVRYESILHFKDGKCTLPSYVTMVVRETNGQFGVTASINPIVSVSEIT